ncbi:hypothetical protein DQW77_17480 [Roseovarius sp. TE539]|uniref:hypothetical protein n=1 Tax=Roseovarius sp. TE539 TaxID=2249812 RepID=UPI000DE0B2B6|nr:hypothetical protein [Roseovarius sp. TE539]RBI67553.1 hypothetical protein DQW77_17480 [Roseovarius sp. TE539]
MVAEDGEGAPGSRATWPDYRLSGRFGVAAGSGAVDWAGLGLTGGVGGRMLGATDTIKEARLTKDWVYLIFLEASMASDPFEDARKNSFNEQELKDKAFKRKIQEQKHQAKLLKPLYKKIKSKLRGSGLNIWLTEDQYGIINCISIGAFAPTMNEGKTSRTGDLNIYLYKDGYEAKYRIEKNYSLNENRTKDARDYKDWLSETEVMEEVGYYVGREEALKKRVRDEKYRKLFEDPWVFFWIVVAIISGIYILA